MSKTLTLNLFGGPGIGKSTLANGVFTLLKMHGVNCEITPEFAKDLTWENRMKTLANQRYIFGKQYHRQWRVRDEVDVIISDSPLLLSLHYQPAHYGDSFSQEVIEAWNEFNNINFLLKRVKEYKTEGRTQTLEEAIKIDNDLELLLNHVRESYTEIPGDYTGINVIASAILADYFDKHLKIRFTGSK